jgi:hypothetical protein
MITRISNIVGKRMARVRRIANYREVNRGRV